MSSVCLAAGWEEQLASPLDPAPTEASTPAECSWPYVWVTGVMAGLLLLAAVAVLIRAVILAILWRRTTCMTNCKANHMQQHESTVAIGDMTEIAGLWAVHIVIYCIEYIHMH